MNTLFANWEQAWLAIGWTMLHFLWLGTAVALCGGAIRLASRRASTAVRYAISLTTLAALAVLPIAITAWLATNTTTPQPIVHVESTTVSVRPQAELAPFPEPLAPTPTPHDLQQPKTFSPPLPPPASLQPQLAPPPAPLETLISALPWLWLIGAPLTFALLATGLIGAERLRRRSQPVESASITQMCKLLCGTLRIGRKVSISICDSLSQPVLIGIVRPLILLPPTALTGWSPEQLEMVLLHELAHVRRWDNLANFVQRVVESLLFFHPVVWIVSRQVCRDREECCDATVVAHTAKPQAYAELLVDIATSPSPLAGLAMARHPLAGRIRRILKLEDEPMLVSRRMFGLIGIALAALLAVAFWQPVESSVAEEADVAEAKQENNVTEDTESTASQVVPDPVAPRTVWEERVGPSGLRERRARTIYSASSSKPGEALLQPGDRIHVEVIEVVEPLDQPSISGEYKIESFGTLALGAAYGRVKVTGKTLLDAEAAVLAHLKTILKDPKVQLTILSRRSPTPFHPTLFPTDAPNAALPSSPQFFDPPHANQPISPNTSTWPQQAPSKQQYREPGPSPRVRPTDSVAVQPGVQGVQQRWSWPSHQNKRVVEQGVQQGGSPGRSQRLDVRPTVPVAVQPSSRTAPTPSLMRDASLPYDIPSPPSGTLLYDGKTFEHWRNLWKTELNIGKRTLAIQAITAFGRAGKGKEAGEAILDVAKGYDFERYGDNQSIRDLKETITNALRKSDGIPADAWVPILLQRLEKEPRRWRGLTRTVLGEVRTDQPDIQQLLLTTAKKSDYSEELRGAALRGLGTARQ